jgi:general secretion pathway protein G
MKKAFTMIELIFVIVILGILAAVAIPKMAATRDDAVVSSMASRIGAVRNEVVAYAYSQINLDSNMSHMSQVLKTMEDNGEVEIGVRYATFIVKNFKCIDMNISSDDTNLSINFRNPNGNSFCTSLQSAVSTMRTELNLKGQTVNY